MGADAADDAAVWRRPDGRALIATVDFFTPIVDDPRQWGAIAAANSASDVYAMGGRPIFGLNVVAWPRDTIPLDLLGEVLAGADEVAALGGWYVVGGHTVDGPEPLYGQAVVGEADADRLLTHDGAHAGEVLVLTKALGTGVVSTAVKRLTPADVAPGGRLQAAYDAAVRSMTTLNADAAEAAIAAGATAGTDVTGFGLVGHLRRMAGSSGVRAVIDLAALPLLEGVAALVEEGFVPGGTGRNLEDAAPWLDWQAPAARRGSWEAVVADPQTSGGLLFSCSAAAAEEAVARLRAEGHAAAVVGRFETGRPGEVVLV